MKTPKTKRARDWSTLGFGLLLLSSAPGLAAGPEESDATQLRAELDRVLAERRLNIRQAAEIKAIKNLCRRIDVDAETIGRYKAAQNLVEFTTVGDRVKVLIHPAYAERMTISIDFQTVRGDGGRLAYHIDGTWRCWGNKDPEFHLTLDPRRRSASLPDGRTFTEFPLRIALPSRPSLLIDWPDDGSSARVHFHNGHVVRALSFEPDGPIRVEPAHAEPEAGRSEPGAVAALPAIVPMLVGKPVFVAGAAHTDARPGLSAQDAALLQRFSEFRSYLSGASDTLQEHIFQTLRQIDRLNDLLDALPANEQLRRRRERVEPLKRLYAALDDDLDRFDLHAAEVTAQQVATTIREIRVRTRLRDLAQEGFLESRGLYRRFLDEAQVAASSGR
jgi:hypothetical protein